MHKFTQQLKASWETVRHIVPRTIRGPLDQRLFFLHLQKCGGTSVNGAIRRLYQTLNPATNGQVAHLDPGAAYRACKDVGMGMWKYREYLAHYKMEQGDTAYVTGHYQVSRQMLEEHGDTFDFLVMLRDPVKKWLSHYFFNRYKDDPRGRIELPIEEYLETVRAADVGCDYVQLVTGTGDDDPKDASDPALIEEALEILDEFAIVGILEHLDTFVETFEQRYGARLNLLHRNRNPASKDRQKREVSDAVRQRIEELCEPNQAVYDAVVEKMTG